MAEILLKELAFARSGDKGDVSNIGVIAKSKAIYDFLSNEITPERVRKHFRGMVKGPVEIYPMPNIECLAIVLRQSLGGGATCNLRFDQTGKAMCMAMLRMELDAGDALINHAREVSEAIEEKYRRQNA
jgi:hypothetical protein